MLTKEQIIAIKKAAIATDPGKPWGTQLHLLAQSNLSFEQNMNMYLIK